MCTNFFALIMFVGGKLLTVVFCDDQFYIKKISPVDKLVLRQFFLLVYSHMDQFYCFRDLSSNQLTGQIPGTLQNLDGIDFV